MSKNIFLIKIGLLLPSVLLTLCISLTASGADECKDSFLASANFNSGLISDLSSNDSIVLINPTLYQSPLFEEVHIKILDNLPPQTKAIIFPGHSKGYETSYANDISSGRFRIEKQEMPWSWAQDFIPFVIKNERGGLELRHFKYFPQRPQAEVAARQFALSTGLPLVQIPIRLEGGNITVDNKGNLFLTELTLADNPNMQKSEIENELKVGLGVKNIVWLPRLKLELTGHLDMYVKLVNNDTFIVSDPLNDGLPSAAQTERKIIDEAVQKLKSLGYKVVRIKTSHSDRSYTNSLIVHNKAFIPTFETDSYSQNSKSFDQEAIAAYKALGFEVIPIPSSDLIQHNGFIHCLTRQFPNFSN